MRQTYTDAKTKSNRFSYILLSIGLLFYLFFALYDGVYIAVDSPTYIEMSITREALYPMYLACFRFLHTVLPLPYDYLQSAVMGQSILAAVAAWHITMKFHKECNLNRMFTSFLFCIPLAVSLLNRFVAQRASMYTNSILTEGMTLSLYLLFFSYLISYVLHHQRKDFIICCVFSGIMIGMRSQMLMTLCLLILATIIVSIACKQYKKGCLQILMGCIAIFASISLIECTYNYVIRDEFVRHTSSNRFIMTMIFYTADREDAAYIPVEEYQDLFQEIYDICDENGYLMTASGNGWYEEVCHFGDHYDHIQIDTMWPMISDYASKHSENGSDTNLLTDDITAVMISSLLPHVAFDVIHVLYNNFLSGLVTTIAQRTPILVLYSILAYMGYLALLVYYFVKCKKCKWDSISTICI
ncbi:MAG: hypothetical protein R3Y24_15215, partial [Eubacteriales bacterium]